MTIREAISGEIEPYGLSDESIEKSFIDSMGRFGSNLPTTVDVETTYDYSLKKVVAYASMLCLSRVRVLSAENIGGIQQTFNMNKIDKQIAAIAKSAGLSPDLVSADSDNDTITYISI